MDNAIPNEIRTQISLATQLLKNTLPQLQTIHLYGSALDGGLKPLSDIDLFVTVSNSLDEDVRKILCTELLKISAYPGTHPSFRALEVTLVVKSDVIPWRHPARRDLQFGEWLRKDILNGVFEGAVIDPDLAILISKVRKNNIALVGPSAQDFFEPIPKKDFFATLKQTLSLWNEPSDWQGDERNILLTLARIWYSAETGEIASKEAAAKWLLQRLPTEYQVIIRMALEEYIGLDKNSVSKYPAQVENYIHYSKSQILSILD